MNRFNAIAPYATALHATAFCAVCLIAFSQSASAEPVNASITKEAQPEAKAVAPLSERFAKAQTKAVPDFQKHVMPLLGRLGCNGRACHGSFQGRGDFQLSLFGYDFKGDHKALHAENTGRVDIEDIEESLILSKPTDADMHEGGKRFDKGTWQHHVIRRWIETGAEMQHEQPLKLEQLEIVPKEVLFSSNSEAVELRAFAHWEDGCVEDVTELCRFSSNDDSIAEIDEHGHLKSGEQGDTHVVVYYDNAVVAVPVLRPVGPLLQSHAKKPIDKLIQQKLDKLGVEPSAICTDSEFVRRASLDITGILPTSDRVREFLDDDSPNKRQKLVNELLESPGYAAWWATRFSDWTGNSEEQLNNVLPIRGAGTRIWHEWLRTRLDDNVAYDDIIAGIVEAKSRDEGESYLEFCENMTEACKPGKEAKFAKREGMPLYWARQNVRKPEEQAIGFAYTFLGVRIECAQCHKHPFDQWSKDDFDHFAKLFAPIRYNANAAGGSEGKKVREELLANVTDGKKLKGGELRKAIYAAARNGETVPFGELLVNTRGVSDKVKKARAQAKKKGRKVPKLNIPEGTILGGDPLKLDKDPRPELMKWLRSPENPYFAKAVVNRIWSNYFGIGIVDPTDDMNLANPPSNAPLLDHLAEQFIANDFDLKWLHRYIVSSDAYQRSADSNATNKMDRLNFARHMPRRLPAEVVYDSVVLATGSDRKTSGIRSEVDAMAIAEGKPRERNKQDYALEVFGQSIRETNCDCDRSDSPSLLQSIYLRNDTEMHKRLADKDGWVAQACRSMGVPGPKASNDPKQIAAKRQAMSMRKQIVARLVNFNKTPRERQKRNRASVEKQYRNAEAKFRKFGYALPPLKELIANPKAWLTEDLEPAGPKLAAGTEARTIDELVEDVYLRTLSRFPDQEETKVSVNFIEESETTADGIQSLLWALVNTKEFIISH